MPCFDVDMHDVPLKRGAAGGHFAPPRVQIVPTPNQAHRKQIAKAKSQPATLARGDGRDEILRAALACFAETGYDGTSIADIARAAGVGHPLVHYHFQTKDLLWREAVVHAFKDLAVAFQAVSLAADDLEPVDALKVVIKAFVRFCSQYPQHIAILFSEGTAKSDRFDWAVETWLKPLHNRVDTLILEAVRRGQIRDVPPVHLANLIVGAAVQFASARELIRQLYDYDTADPANVASHADWLVDVMLNGIRSNRT